MSADVARSVVGGLLLAGGRGRRFGSDKRAALLPDGTTMLARSLELLRGEQRVARRQCLIRAVTTDRRFDARRRDRLGVTIQPT